MNVQIEARAGWRANQPTLLRLERIFRTLIEKPLMEHVVFYGIEIGQTGSEMECCSQKDSG